MGADAAGWAHVNGNRSFCKPVQGLRVIPRDDKQPKILVYLAEVLATDLDSLEKGLRFESTVTEQGQGRPRVVQLLAL
ncbi:MAG: hypothetical protein KY449_07755 [Proteobacteria bacterium]|nr:hypothetical protein [Pseudomonadota bacterium]